MYINIWCQPQLRAWYYNTRVSLYQMFTSLSAFVSRSLCLARRSRPMDLT